MDKGFRSPGEQASTAATISANPREERKPQQARAGSKGGEGLGTQDDGSGCDIYAEADQRKACAWEVGHHCALTVDRMTSNFEYKGYEINGNTCVHFPPPWTEVAK